MKFGYVKSQNDPRDYLYSQLVYTADKLPRKHLPPRIKVNKQTIGNCVGESGRSVKVLHEMENYPGANYDFDPDFLYSECKKRDGIPHIEGTYPRVAMAVLKDLGISQFGLYPRLKKHNDRPEPSPEAVENASKFKIGAYARVSTIQEMKDALVNQGPILAGFLCTDTMTRKDHDGVIVEPHGYMVGGHAVTIDGYDDDMVRVVNGKTYKGFFRFINSWGEEWGDKGYGWFAYDFINFRSDLGMAFFEEAWTSVDVILPDERVKFMTMWLDSKKVIVNGQEEELEVAAYSLNGRTMVPLRFLVEKLGFTVLWNDDERRIDIYR